MDNVLRSRVLYAISTFRLLKRYDTAGTFKVIQVQYGFYQWKSAQNAKMAAMKNHWVLNK